MTWSLFLLFNHQLTPMQAEDARISLGIDQIRGLPPDLNRLWRNIPPEMPEIGGHLEPVKNWLSAHARESDYVLIQGDFGACCIMVNFAFEKGLIPIYSTTHRDAVEEHGANGSVRLNHVFKHRIFRRYGF